MVILFFIGYFGFIFVYPLLQLWTLVRCRDWWRAASVFCLIPAVPFYIWSVQDFLHPQDASLLALFVAGIGLLPLLYLTVIAVGYELVRRRATVSNELSAIPLGDNRGT